MRTHFPAFAGGTANLHSSYAQFIVAESLGNS